MRISLFGATGQIGLAVTRALVSEGHDVGALVRSESERWPDSVKVSVASDFDFAAISRALEGADFAVYAVGMAEQWVPDPAVFQRVNVDLFELFLQALGRSGTRAVMYISTFEVFSTVDGRIQENNPLADPAEFSPYYRSMFAGYELARAFADREGIRMVTLHPAAVYGGRNTGRGLTDFLENVVRRRFWRVPFIPPTSFPAVHVDSLADAAVRALDEEGSFIVSDGVTSLKAMAQTARRCGGGFVPPRVPLKFARGAASLMGTWARLTGRPPLLAHVQLDYLTAGHRPAAEKARAELSWRPLSVEQGIERYVRQQARRAE